MILFLLSSLIFSSSAQTGSTTDALGGTGIGAAHPLESIFLNPAALGRFDNAYAGVQYFSGDLGSGSELHQYSAMITDATAESMFPGGLAYRNRNYDVAGTTVREQLFQLAMAYKLSEDLALGLAGYKLKTDLPTGIDYNQYNADVSVFWQSRPDFSLGAVMRGVLGSKDNVPFAFSEIKPNAGMGAMYTFMEMVSIRADLNYVFEDNPHKHWQHRIGLETTNSEYVSIRAGLSGDDYKGESRWSAGIAWVGPRLKAGYAFQQETRRRLGDAHTIDIWLDF